MTMHPKTCLQEMEDCPTEVFYRDDINLADVFEPNHLRAAFTEKKLNLGSLIFGKQKSQELGVPISSAVDPLTVMFTASKCHNLTELSPK